MRLSRFWTLMEDEFGASYAHVLAGTLVLTEFQLSVEEALRRGVAPRAVWEAVCRQQEVPEERRLGHDRPPKP